MGHLPDGTPYFAPLGELPYDPAEDKVQCHLCGGWFRSIAGQHLWGGHGWHADDYREVFGLERSHGLVSPGTAERLAAALRRRIAADPRLRRSMAREQRRIGEVGRRAAAQRRGHRQRLEHARKSAANVAAAYEQRIAARGAQARHQRQQEAQAIAQRLGFTDIAAYLRDRLEQGVPLRAIAAQTGHDSAWVRRLAVEHGLYQPPPAVDGDTLWRAASAAHGFDTVRDYLRDRRHDREWTLAQIAREVGVSTSATVSARLRKEGLAARSAATVRNRSLAVKHPELLAEWHPGRNQRLQPDVHAAGSARKVWWRCRTCGHQRHASTLKRGRGQGCPRCVRQRVPYERSLALLRPELAAELHPSRNTSINPYALGARTQRRVWWRCRRCAFEWQASVEARTHGGGKCPACSERERQRREQEQARAQRDVQRRAHRQQRARSLASRRPDLAIELRDLDPQTVAARSKQTVWWRCSHCSREWQQTPGSRAQRATNGCRACATARRKGETRPVPAARTLAARRPDLLADVHPTRNGNLDVTLLAAGSTRAVWWRCQACGHEWRATMLARAVRGTGCPACARKRAGAKTRQTLTDRLPFERSLQSRHPTLVGELHPDRNGQLDPSKIAAGTRRRLWWQCPSCSHEWQAGVLNRAHGSGCPNCARRRAAGRLRTVAPERSLLAKRPDIAVQLHPTRKGKLDPHTLGAASSHTAWWQCPCGHEWQASIVSRTTTHGRCPACRQPPP